MPGVHNYENFAPNTLGLELSWLQSITITILCLSGVNISKVLIFLFYTCSNCCKIAMTRGLNSCSETLIYNG